MPKILISKTFSFFIVLLLTKGTTYQGKTFLFIEKKEKSSPNLQDGTKKIILNAGAFEQTDNHELQGFLRYVKTGELTTDYTKRIERMIQTVKMSEQARQEYRFKSAVIMDAEDRGLERGLAEGEARGSRQAKLETARLMKAEALASDLIMKITGLSKEEVEAID